MTDKRHSPLMMGGWRVEVGAQGKYRNRGWGEGPKSKERKMILKCETKPQTNFNYTIFSSDQILQKEI